MRPRAGVEAVRRRSRRRRRRFALFARSVIYVDAGRTDAAVKEIEKVYALDASWPTRPTSPASAPDREHPPRGRKPDEAAKRFGQALTCREVEPLPRR